MRTNPTNQISLGFKAALFVPILAMAILALGVSSASASGGEPWWYVQQLASPTHIPASVGATGEIVLRVSDIGDGPLLAASEPVQISDVLPEGLEATGITGEAWRWTDAFNPAEPEKTSEESLGLSVVCSRAEVSCTYDTEDLSAFSWIEVKIQVAVKDPATASGENRVSVSGGGAPPASREQMVTVSDEPAPFGVESGSFEMRAENEGGAGGGDSIPRPAAIPSS